MTIFKVASLGSLALSCARNSRISIGLFDRVAKKVKSLSLSTLLKLYTSAIFSMLIPFIIMAGRISLRSISFMSRKIYQSAPFLKAICATSFGLTPLNLLRFENTFSIWNERISQYAASAPGASNISILSRRTCAAFIPPPARLNASLESGFSTFARLSAISSGSILLAIAKARAFSSFGSLSTISFTADPVLWLGTSSINLARVVCFNLVGSRPFLGSTRAPNTSIAHP